MPLLTTGFIFLQSSFAYQKNVSYTRIKHTSITLTLPLYA